MIACHCPIGRGMAAAFSVLRFITAHADNLPSHRPAFVRDHRIDGDRHHFMIRGPENMRTRSNGFNHGRDGVDNGNHRGARGGVAGRVGDCNPEYVGAKG